MQVTAKLNNLRVSPKKVRLVVGLIKGLDVTIAQQQLAVLPKGSAKDVLKLLNSAIANGENNFGLTKANLLIKKITVDSGFVMKRWMPRAFGRASMLRKKSSKVNLILDEKVATPIDQIKKQAPAVKAVTIAKQAEQGIKKQDNLSDKNKSATIGAKGASAPAKGFSKKLFQRKAG